MSHNGTKTKAKSSNQDYMNLLYSDSDSDRVPDLKLPPLKGKKFKRKKSSGARQEESMCNVWTAVKIFLVLVVLLSLITLGMICFWSLQKINELQDKVTALRDSNAKTPDAIVKIQFQLEEVNKTVVDIRSGASGLEALVARVKQISLRMKEVEDANQQLKSTVASSKDILNLPNQVKALTATVATLGSDVKQTQQVQNDMQTQVAGVENRVKTLEEHRADALQVTTAPPSLDTQSGTELRGLLGALNQTIDNRLMELAHKLEQHEGRISVLEGFVSDHAEVLALDEDTVKQYAASALNEMLVNQTLGSREGGADLQSIQGALHELSDQTTALTQEMNKLQVDGPLGPLGQQGDFLAFKEDVQNNFGHVNASILTITEELTALSSRVNLVDLAVVNITTTLSKQLDRVTPQSQVSSTVPSSVEQGKTTQTELPPGAGSSSYTTTSTTQGRSGLSTAPQPEKVSVSPRPSVAHIEGINSVEDLHTAFMESWPQNNGLLDLATLNAEILKDSPLDVKVMEKYDENGDGLYSVDEMAAALGLQ